MTKAPTEPSGMTEDDNFIVKAAMQLGFEFVQGNASTMQVSMRNLIAFVRRIEAAERIRCTAYPKQMTTELREVLGLMPAATGPIARDFRAAGEDIPNRLEAEQAFVLHWLIGLALRNGPAWRSIAAAEIGNLPARGRPEERRRQKSMSR
jgi:hypothetical protein